MDCSRKVVNSYLSTSFKANCPYLLVADYVVSYVVSLHIKVVLVKWVSLKMVSSIEAVWEVIKAKHQSYY